MAKSHRHRIGRVSGMKPPGQAQQRLHHGPHLVLARTTRTGHRLLDLVRRVLDHLAPSRGRLSHDHAASLTHSHSRGSIPLEQNPLHRHHVRPKFGNQIPHLRLKLGQPNRPLKPRIGSDNPSRHRPGPDPLLHTAITAPRQPRINPQHEHPYTTLPHHPHPHRGPSGPKHQAGAPRSQPECARLQHERQAGGWHGGKVFCRTAAKNRARDRTRRPGQTPTGQDKDNQEEVS